MYSPCKLIRESTRLLTESLLGSNPRRGMNAPERVSVSVGSVRTPTFPGSIAAMHLTVNQRIVGSNPTLGALARWQSGSCAGLQNPLQGFDSPLRLWPRKPPLIRA